MVAFWERKRQEGGLRLDHFLVQADNSVVRRRRE